ncbi:hypothetical protein INT44_007323 [Umbelopsis vinacea]|uniref:Uncharacterized protein n=1 Tax=Umbelopsis vinacea TaxID=44442 RepID=A0A8H7PNI5_9FUNG|nr:hypothetical protein INT44_007323 [Umbelopsis vinacea]
MQNFQVNDENLAKICVAVSKALEKIMQDLELQYPMIFSVDYINSMKGLSHYVPIIASSLLHIAQNSRSVDLKNYALTHFSGSDISLSERSSSINSFAVSEQNLMTALYRNVRMGYATQITRKRKRFETSSDASYDKEKHMYEEHGHTGSLQTQETETLLCTQEQTSLADDVFEMAFASSYQ